VFAQLIQVKVVALSGPMVEPIPAIHWPLQSHTSCAETLMLPVESAAAWDKVQEVLGGEGCWCSRQG
jgi:hypothetical protein